MEKPRQTVRQPLLNLCNRDKRGVMEKLRQTVRKPLLNLCTRDKRERERAGANFTTVSVKPFVRPRIFAQQKCTLLARNGILSVLRNRVHTAVGVLGTVGGANAVKAPPFPLK